MAKKALLYVFAGAAILLLSAIAPAASSRPAVRDIDAFRYDVLAERLYQGTVESKGHVVDGLMYFSLRLPDHAVEVQIGPEEFVERSGFKLTVGETVTAAGMPLVWNGRDIVLAREVRSMTSVLVIRDRKGYPMWDTKRPVQGDPEIPASNLCELMNYGIKVD